MTAYLDQSSSSQADEIQAQSMSGSVGSAQEASLATPWSGVIRFSKTSIDYSTTRLLDGGFAIVFSQEDYTTGALRFTMKVQLFNADGSERGDVISLGNPLTYENARHVKAITLANGNIAFAYSDVGWTPANNPNNGMYVQTFDPLSGWISGRQKVGGAAPTTNEIPYQMFAKDDGFAITYKDPADTEKYYFAVYGADPTSGPRASNESPWNVKDYGWTYAQVSGGSSAVTASLSDLHFQGSSLLRITLEAQSDRHYQVVVPNTIYNEIELVRGGPNAVVLITLNDQGQIRSQKYSITYAGQNTTIDPVGSSTRLSTSNGFDLVTKELPDGRIVLAWTGIDLRIHAMILNQDGTVNTSEFLVDNVSPGEQTKASINILQDGRFSISWDVFKAFQGQTSGIIDTKIFDPRESAVNLLGQNSANNWYYGTNWNDTITGSTKQDRFYGEKGDDRLDGKEGNDVLFGGGGNDSLTGGTGDDVLVGGPGPDGTREDSDVLDGGADFDVVNYFDAEGFVIASLDPTVTNNGKAAGDQFISIEGLVGSAYGDGLRGNDIRNTLDGQGGNDKIYGGGGNDDILMIFTKVV